MSHPAFIAEHATLDVLGTDIRRVALGAPKEDLYLREDLAARVAALLQGGTSVLLTGDPGTGKTSLVRSLVSHSWTPQTPEQGQLRLVETRKVPAPLIIETHPGKFIEHCHYAHDLENRMGLLMQVARSRAAILFIDGVDGIIGTGSTYADPSSDVANLMLPHMESGLVVIGATTLEGQARMRSRNRRLLERFAVVEVPPPDDHETRQIARLKLNALRAGGAHVDAHALDAGLELAARFMPGRPRLAGFTSIARQAASTERSVDPSSLRRAVALELGVLPGFVGAVEPPRAAALHAQLAEQVFGQEDAVTEVASALTRFSAGMVEPGRPIAAYLLAGPTGTGKTSLALATARTLTGDESAVIRLDMSEYSSPFSAGRLIEDSEHSLVGRLLARPAGVLLLDEIEKAHPSVTQLLLGALGEARLTGESGRTVRLDNYLIMLTTNVGARRWSLRLPAERTVPLVRADIAETFAPEFLGRMTRTIVFEPLTTEVGARIVARELARLNELPGIVERGLQLVWAETLAPTIARLGVSVERGARGVQQAVRTLVASPLACWMSEHPEASNGIVMLAPRLQGGALASLAIDWVDESGFFREVAN